MARPQYREISNVQLWHISPEGKRRLFNDISSSSKFFGFKQPNNMFKLENRIQCARILRDGWIYCNQYPGKWEILIVETEEIVS